MIPRKPALLTMFLAAAGFGSAAAADPWVVQTPRADGEIVVRRTSADEIGVGDRVEVFFLIESIGERARRATGEVIGVESDVFTVRPDPGSLSGRVSAGDLVALLERAEPGSKPELPVPLVPLPPGPQSQGYATVRNFEEFKAHLQERWKSGHASTSIAYGEGRWLATTTSGTPAKDQLWLSAGDSAYVRKMFAENAANGFALSCVDCIGSTWIATFSKGLPITGQTWKSRTSPAELIGDAKVLVSEGYAITALTHDKNAWFAVFSKGTGFTSQAVGVFEGLGEINDAVNEWWNKGYRITCASSFGGVWLIVFSQNSGYTIQAWRACETLSQATAFIKEKWDEGLLITTTVRGKGSWLIVMSQGPIRW